MKQSADALFAKTEDGIMPVMLEETHTYKKLLLSWNKGTQGVLELLRSLLIVFTL